jgi:hypothetical protein
VGIEQMNALPTDLEFSMQYDPLVIVSVVRRISTEFREARIHKGVPGKNRQTFPLVTFGVTLCRSENVLVIRKGLRQLLCLIFPIYVPISVVSYFLKPYEVWRKPPDEIDNQVPPVHPRLIVVPDVQTQD